MVKVTGVISVCQLKGNADVLGKNNGCEQVGSCFSQTLKNGTWT